VGDDGHRAAVFQVNISSSIFAVVTGSSAEQGSSSKQHFGIDGQRARDAQTLLLAAGKRKRRFVQVILHFVPQRGAAQAVLDEIVEAPL
jgi:hypothetical protein